MDFFLFGEIQIDLIIFAIGEKVNQIKTDDQDIQNSVNKRKMKNEKQNKIQFLKCSKVSFELCRADFTHRDFRYDLYGRLS